MKLTPHDPAWSDLPFMTKEDLRTLAYDPEGLRSALAWYSSSGSTEAPVIYPWTAEDEAVACATVQRVHADDPCWPGHAGMVIAPTGLPGMWSHMARQLRALGLATVFPGVESPERILALIDKLRPRVVISLPLVLSRVGELLRATGRAPTGAALLLSGGDVLSASRQRRIEALWGAPVRNCYGLSEVFGPLAVQAPGTPVLVWRAPDVHVDLLDPATRRAVQPGETGVAVITTLWERPAALRRYWTGDEMRLLRWEAPGRPVFELRGRETVRLPGGVLPIDLDELLLSTPEVGNEWSLSRAPEGHWELTVEAHADAQPVREVLDRAARTLRADVRTRVRAPGTLDRRNPKLAVPAG